MGTKNSSRFTPLIIAISVVAGILIGTFYAKHFAGNRLGIINGSSNKLNALLRDRPRRKSNAADTGRT